jgi:hypothetical protein
MTEEIMISSGGPKRSVSRAWLAVAALSCGAALIVGCSSASSSTSSSPKTTTSPVSHSPTPSSSSSAPAAACVHINSLRTSLTSLTHIKVSPSSASQLTSDLTNIETQLAALKGMSLGAFSTEANQLTAAVNKIKKDAAQLSTNPTAAVKSLTADLTTLKNNAGPMIAEMKAICHVS